QDTHANKSTSTDSNSNVQNSDISFRRIAFQQIQANLQQQQQELLPADEQTDKQSGTQIAAEHSGAIYVHRTLSLHDRQCESTLDALNVEWCACAKQPASHHQQPITSCKSQTPAPTPANRQTKSLSKLKRSSDDAGSLTAPANVIQSMFIFQLRHLYQSLAHNSDKQRQTSKSAAATRIRRTKFRTGLRLIQFKDYKIYCKMKLKVKRHKANCHNCHIVSSNVVSLATTLVLIVQLTMHTLTASNVALVLASQPQPQHQPQAQSRHETTTHELSNSLLNTRPNSDLLLSTDDAWALEVNNNNSNNQSQSNGAGNESPSLLESSMRIVRLVAPHEAIESGSQNVTLDCVIKYDKKIDRRLTIKWYYNDDAMPVYQYIAELNTRTFNPKYERFIDKWSYEPPLALARVQWSSSSSARAGIAHTDEMIAHQPDVASPITNDNIAQHRALRLVRPTHELSGKFTCVVSSLENYDAKSTNLVVYVPAKRFDFYVQRVPGGYNVTCRAYGVFPRPQLTLYRHADPPAIGDTNWQRLRNSNNQQSVSTRAREPTYELSGTENDASDPNDGFDVLAAAGQQHHAAPASSGAHHSPLNSLLPLPSGTTQHTSAAGAVSTTSAARRARKLHVIGQDSSVVEHQQLSSGQLQLHKHVAAPVARIIATDERPTIAASAARRVGDRQLSRLTPYDDRTLTLDSSTTMTDNVDGDVNNNGALHDDLSDAQVSAATTDSMQYPSVHSAAANSNELFSVTSTALIEETSLSSQVATHFECQLTMEATNYSQSKSLALQRGILLAQHLTK
ncbi:hypothetical protein GZH46_01083, partial [Fragariocoptes setiger]